MASRKKKLINTELAIGFTGKPVYSELKAKDSIIYAISLGYNADPLNVEELKFTYELNEQFRTVPTIGSCIINVDVFGILTTCPGIPQFNPMMILHGEQNLEIYKTIKPNMKIETLPKIADIVDKVKGALVVFQLDSYDVSTEKKELVFTNFMSLYIRGLGGFGFQGKLPKKENLVLPTTTPDKTHTEKTIINQAIIYRLNGDYNPLHIDPSLAELGGFERPILHGLCTYGLATKAVLKEFCNNDVTLIKEVSCRFTSHVYPGETLQFSMWQNKNKIIYSAITLERKKEVICGTVTLTQEITPKL